MVIFLMCSMLVLSIASPTLPTLRKAKLEQVKEDPPSTGVEELKAEDESKPDEKPEDDVEHVDSTPLHPKDSVASGSQSDTTGKTSGNGQTVVLSGTTRGASGMTSSGSGKIVAHSDSSVKKVIKTAPGNLTIGNEVQENFCEQNVRYEGCDGLAGSYVNKNGIPPGSIVNNIVFNMPNNICGSGRETEIIKTSGTTPH